MVWEIIVKILIQLALSAISASLTSSKNKGPKAATEDDVTGPDATEGSPFPAIFGSPWAVPLSAVAKMDFGTEPIKEKTGKK